MNNVAERVEEIYDISDDVGFQTTEQYVRLTMLCDLANVVDEEISNMYDDYEMNDILEWHIRQIGKLVWEIHSNARRFIDEVEYTVENRSFETDGKMYVDRHGVSILFGTMTHNITLYSMMAKEHIDLLLEDDNDVEEDDDS